MDTRTPSESLRDIKDLTGLSEVALARRLGVSQPTVNRILHGKSDCKASTLIAIQSWRSELATEEAR
ncbi:helix-turn-helix domain-containing protein [Burkholderia gladioli]|uniref:helix-turn-helix domain-containing protein n=1 Tax=Burkholderia gladioli TaxID=28095 RepID=UPI00163FA852|nr:helix-turn-helix transcriptional regulator [Burkholderia gladioli]